MSLNKSYYLKGGRSGCVRIGGRLALVLVYYMPYLTSNTKALFQRKGVTLHKFLSEDLL